MNFLSLSNHFVRQFRVMPWLMFQPLSSSSKGIGDNSDSQGVPQEAVDDSLEPSYPTFKKREGESLEVLKARLLYQSRKRGTLENGLLLSTFAARYLSSMTPRQLEMYDQLINKPSNEWDIYYWITGKSSVPEEYDNELFALLKKHAKNEGKELRVIMPDLMKH